MEEKRPQTNTAATPPSAIKGRAEATEQTASQPEPVPPAKRKKREDFLPLRIVTMVFYVAIACFLLYELTDCAIKMHKNDPTSGLNLALFLIIFLVWGSFANLVPTVLAIVGAILSKKRMKARGETGIPVYFTVMSILPYATELICIAICYLLPRLFP